MLTKPTGSLASTSTRQQSLSTFKSHPSNCRSNYLTLLLTTYLLYHLLSTLQHIFIPFVRLCTLAFILLIDFFHTFLVSYIYGTSGFLRARLAVATFTLRSPTLQPLILSYLYPRLFLRFSLINYTTKQNNTRYHLEAVLRDCYPSLVYDHLDKASLLYLLLVSISCRLSVMASSQFPRNRVSFVSFFTVIIATLVGTF